MQRQPSSGKHSDHALPAREREQLVAVAMLAQDVGLGFILKSI